MKATSNKNARVLVNGLTDFKGSNTFAETNAPRDNGLSPQAPIYPSRPTYLYVVYSYGYHFPLYVAEWFEGQEPTWYENSDKYSQSTTRQQSLLRPSAPTIKMGNEQMKTLSKHGIVGVVVQPDNNSLTRMTVEEINQAIHNIANSKLAHRLSAW